MSKPTQTKRGRRFVQIAPGKYLKLPHPTPARELEPVHIEFRGGTYTEYVAPGQVLNPKRVYKRYLSKQLKHA